jgi:transglutaminase-like putative cysteine protease
MPILTVRHLTTYRYKQPVAFGEHRIMFRPRDSYDQRLLEATLVVKPEPSRLHWMHDVFGNCVAVACFGRRARELRFESTIRLDHSPLTSLDFPISPHARTYPFTYDAEDMPDLTRLMEREYPDRAHELTAWAHGFVPTGRRIGSHDLLAAIARAIKRDFTYVRRSEQGIRPPLETLRLRSGSCRDFALLMMEAVRALGFAARFVSGYLYVPGRDGVGRIGGGSTHAWVQVYLPGAGWLEFDPTNGILDNRDLIRVAVARSPAQAVPLWGTWTGFPSDSLGMTVEVYIDSSAAGDPAPVAAPPVAAMPVAAMPVATMPVAAMPAVAMPDAAGEPLPQPERHPDVRRPALRA